jgi:uncharacterized membrane protein YuzA (DUF378 family)
MVGPFPSVPRNVLDSWLRAIIDHGIEFAAFCTIPLDRRKSAWESSYQHEWEEGFRTDREITHSNTEKETAMRTLNIIALILVIIGGLNWLLVGLFGFDLVAAIFANGYGTLSVLSRIVYILVGVSSIWLLFTLLPAVSTTPSYQQTPTT